MKKKVKSSIIIGILLIFPVIANAEQIIKGPKTITTSYDENAPTWTEEDSWTYNVDFTGGVLDIFEFELGFRSLKFIVDQETSSSYKMKVYGYVIGEITIQKIQIIRGTFRDTTITGDVIFAKPNIGIEELDVHISGDIQLIFRKPFAIDLTLSFDPAYIPIDWPLSVGKQWDLPVSYIEGFLDFTFDGDLIFDDLDVPEITGGQPVKCTGIETKTVPAGTFDAYKIEGIYDEIEFYYASAAGNIINLYNVLEELTIEMNLVSNPPLKPQTPEGPPTGSPGNRYTYSSQTTDPDDDDIYYMFDWDDDSTSDWIGPKPSGQPASALKTWSSQGTYQVKVVSKDEHGILSEWSEPLTVTMPRNKAINTPFQWFLQQHPNLFPIFRYLLGL